MYAELSTAITGLKALKDVATGLVSAKTMVDQAELKLRVAEQLSKMADLTFELTELREKARLKEELTFADGVYWPLGEESEEGLGRRIKKDETPFCPRCFEVDGKAIHLISDGFQRAYLCPECKQTFGTQRRD